jgi:iron uptake system EfeUOB component EfeO/EfeM
MSAPDTPSKPGPSGAPPALRFAVPAAAILAIAGAGAFYVASQMRGTEAAPEAYKVTVTAKACEPNELTVPAGSRTFEIFNQSDRPVEWEILDGVMVVAERENIAPGFRQTLDARLKPGDFAITCGLLSNPRGVLHVTTEGASDETGKTPETREFIGALAEYHVYNLLEALKAEKAATALAEAIHAGDLDRARSLYAPARRLYKHVEPVASYYFSDLVNAINPSAAYLEKREADPAFTGFHRIAYSLYGGNDVAGLPAIADKLVEDLGNLKSRLRAVRLVPSDLADIAARTADQLAAGRIVDGEDSYAGIDLSDINASLESITKLVTLLRPVVTPAAPDAMAKVDASLTAATDALAAFRTGDTWPAYDTVDVEHRKALADAFRALADALAAVNQAIGIA